MSFKPRALAAACQQPAHPQCNIRVHPLASGAKWPSYTKTACVDGFTLIEILVVIVLLGIFLGILLPRFVNLTEDTRSAHAQSVASSFSTAITNYRAAWLAAGQPTSLDLQGKSVAFDTDGWPHSAVVSTPICLDLWDTAFHGAQPITAYVPGAAADDWTTIGFGTTCAYVYQNGGVLSNTSLRPIFFYRPVDGIVTIQRFFM